MNDFIRGRYLDGDKELLNEIDCFLQFNEEQGNIQLFFDKDLQDPFRKYSVVDISKIMGSKDKNILSIMMQSGNMLSKKYNILNFQLYDEDSTQIAAKILSWKEKVNNRMKTDNTTISSKFTSVRGELFGKVKCNFCGASNSKNSQFCSKCGNKN